MSGGRGLRMAGTLAAVVAVGALAFLLVFPPRTTPELIEDLMSFEPGVGGRAHRALVRRGREAAPALGAELRRRENTYQLHIVLNVLKEMGDEAEVATQDIVAVLKGHRSESVRESAAESLGRIGGRSQTVKSALEGALVDDDQCVRVNAARALRSLWKGYVLPDNVREELRENDSIHINISH